MKFGAVLLFAALVCYAEALHCSIENLAEVVKNCITESKSTEIDFIDLITMKPARSDNAKCFRHCIIKDCSYVNSSGQISADFARDTGVLLGAGDVEKTTHIENIAAACVESTKHQDNLCQYSENIFQCIVTSCKSCGLIVPNIVG